MPHDDKEPKKPHPKPENGHNPEPLDAPAEIDGGSGGNSPPPQPPKKP
jgi:hypothetical protein